MVEFGNSLDPDRELDVLHGILDIPMEILEGDEDAGDWDIDNGQCLGPIPSNFLMELSSAFNKEFDSAPIAGAHEQRKSDRVQECGSFHTQSPITVLESSDSSSREKNLSIVSDNAIPLPPRKKSKPARYSDISPEPSTSEQTSNSGRSKESRKRLSATDLMGNTPQNVDSSLNISDPTLQISSKPCPPLAKKCAHCQSSETPLWRDGPLGPGSLCNACGVRHRSGRLFPEYRPKASPTFVASQHSNSHRKVTEMRNKAKLLNVEMKVAPLSPRKESKIEEPPIAPRVEAKISELPCSQMIAEGPEQQKLDGVQESGSFHPQSHVLVLKSSSGSCSGEENLSIISRERNLSIISYNAITLPPRKRSKPARYLGSFPEPSTSKQTSSSRRSKESRKQLPVAMNLLGNSIDNVDSSLSISDPTLQVSSKPCPPLAKKCGHCQSSKTPQWRDWPLGPSTLCNPCGFSYQSGRPFPEYRPKASPTFVASQHSNSHKKVAEMRDEAKLLNFENKIDGTPEQKQLPLHTDTSNSLVLPPIAGAHKQRKSDRVQESGSLHNQSPVSVLESSSSSLREKNLPIVSENAIPLPPRQKSKPARNSDISPEPSTSEQTSSGRGKESRKRLSVETDLMGNTPQNVDSSSYISDPAHQTSCKPCPPLVKKCAHCQSSETPQWRDGPLGPSTLCNACGVRYRSGRLFPEYRPKASPTFVASQHSNCHRKVAEMRNKAKLLNIEMKVAPLSPRKEAKTEEPPIAPQMEAKISELPCSQMIAEAPKQRKLDGVQESGSFHPQSHVLVLKSSSGSCSGEENISIISRERNLPIISDNPIPLPPRNRSKPARYLGSSPEPSASKQTSNLRRSKEKRKRLPVAMDLMGNTIDNVDNSLNISDPTHQVSSKPRPPLVKKCAHCQSSKTPQWRDGPLGQGSLCNACGVHYRSGRLFPEYQPKASPTFIASQHSNSHRKVAETRNEAKLLNFEIMVAPLSPKKEAKLEEPSIAPRIEANNFELPTPPMIDGAPEQKQLPLHTDTSNSLVPPPIDGAPEQKHVEGMQLPKHAETSTHVSLLESSRSYLKYRSKYFKHAVSDGASLLNGSTACPAAGKKCAHCETTNTPQWRRGPLGPHTLCNACGLQYRAGCLVPEYRLEASPTFVPSQTSNSQRKLVQIRTKAMQSSADISKEKCCAHCQSTQTSSGWRTGPLGPSTLCNACGKRYRAGRLVPEYRSHRRARSAFHLP